MRLVWQTKPELNPILDGCDYAFSDCGDEIALPVATSYPATFCRPAR